MKYPGSKTAEGIPQFIINNIPYHTRYFELFAGSAAIYRHKLPAAFSWLNDKHTGLKSYLNQFKGPATQVTHFDTLQLLGEINFTSADFIYLDPPYRFNTRRNKAPLYVHEMTDEQHTDLLQLILTLPCMVMISCYLDEVYHNTLHVNNSWRFKTFTTRVHGGNVTEYIYMNYQEPDLLHDYRHLGADAWKRQEIKRKQKAFSKKFSKLNPHERALLIKTLCTEYPALAQHFLTVMHHK